MEKRKKKIKNNKIKYRTSEQREIEEFIAIVVLVVAIVGLIYCATRFFIVDESSDNETEEVLAGTVNYEVAIMGQLLNRPYDEYYVAIYNNVEGDYIAEMSTLVYNYTQKEKHLHMYTIDLSNKLNEGYYDPENVNTKAKKLSDIKVGDITLIKVKNGKINKYIVDYAKMQKELGIEE